MKLAIDILDRRRTEILEWIKENDPACVKEQRHMDEGTPERSYWHYGYAAALKDVLALLGQASTLKN